MSRSPAENAQLALLLEVASTPKPGNVDRLHDYPELRFEHFLAGAVGALSGLKLAAEGKPIGAAFERAIAGMSQQSGGNTQFGAILMLVPLVSAATSDGLSPEGAAGIVSATTVEDAAGFYRAFDHVEVAVADPPAGMEELDVRRGSEAVTALRERGLTLGDVMARSAEHDGLAAEWVGEFPRTFRAADRLLALEGSVPDRAAHVFLELLAEEPDTFVAIRADRATAQEVSRRAAAALQGDEEPAALADEFVDRDINPGTTADITAAALFVALERGLEV